MASSCICKRLWDSYKVSYLSQQSGYNLKSMALGKALINNKQPLIHSDSSAKLHPCYVTFGTCYLKFSSPLLSASCSAE